MQSQTERKERGAPAPPTLAQSARSRDGQTDDASPSLGSPPPLFDLSSLKSSMTTAFGGPPAAPTPGPAPPPKAPTPDTTTKMAASLNMIQIAEVRDSLSLGVSVFVRIVRIMVLWIILYFVDRAFQAVYIESVMSKEGGDADTPVTQLNPRLWSMMLVVLAVEAVVFFALYLVLAALKKRFKAPNNAFVIDDALMRRILMQYLSTVAFLAPLGIMIGYTMQSCAELRYRDDGLRGIRALAVLLLILCIIVVAVVP